jgi:pectin methylesterase-like acyl-CoA thioesterase
MQVTQSTPTGDASASAKTVTGRRLARLAAGVLLLAFEAAAVTALVGARQTAVRPTGPGTGERADIIVAQDGTGQFRTIQQALDSLSEDSARARIILVRNGTYTEKISIRSSHVALVGEDRDATKIVFAELRKNWRLTHPDDWGAAVINIADTVTDVFIGNMTVHNNYGSLHGDHDHQFAIRSGGIATRITMVHDRIVADGADTLSLWNTGNGMYYHAEPGIYFTKVPPTSCGFPPTRSL